MLEPNTTERQADLEGSPTTLRKRRVCPGQMEKSLTVTEAGSGLGAIQKHQEGHGTTWNGFGSGFVPPKIGHLSHNQRTAPASCHDLRALPSHPPRRIQVSALARICIERQTRLRRQQAPLLEDFRIGRRRLEDLLRPFWSEQSEPCPRVGSWHYMTLYIPHDVHPLQSSLSSGWGPMTLAGRRYGHRQTI